MALEYLPNGDLVSLLGAPAQHWLTALRAVVAALTDLHAYGVAHGDLKARNVLFARDRQRPSHRLDGRARRRCAGRPQYCGVQSAGRQAAATARAADCFAFAVLVHELATAQLPYGAEGPTRLGEIRPAAVPLDPQAARLVAAAEPMLAAGGGLPQGLSYFADVIESVGAVGA